MATKRTVTLAAGNSPAEARAVEASWGRAVRIIEDARVKGRSLSGYSESGIAAPGVVGSEGENGEAILVVGRFADDGGCLLVGHERSGVQGRRG